MIGSKISQKAKLLSASRQIGDKLMVSIDGLLLPFDLCVLLSASRQIGDKLMASIDGLLLPFDLCVLLLPLGG